MSVTVEPIKKHIGAIVHGDRAALLGEGLASQYLEWLEKYTVLVFPRVGLTDAEQLTFTDSLGERVRTMGKVPGADATTPDVYKVTLDRTINTQPEYVQGTFFWHMDGVTIDIPPPRATLLSARRVSAKGGQTEFASTYAAYENLPDDEKAEIKDLRAVHSVRASMRAIVDTLTEAELKRLEIGMIKEHPIVWNRASGRKSLVIGSTTDRVVGMELPNGRALLTRLVEWAAQPDFSYRHYWQEGDFVIWDNCGALHRVIPYDSESGRSMHRTALSGTELVN